MDRPTAAAFSPQRFRLGDVLVSKGLVNAEQLAQALELQKTTGRKLGRALTELKFVTDEQIAQVVADQLGIQFVDLRHRELDGTLVRRLSEAQARRFRALVLEQQPDALLVGMVDAGDMLSFDQIGRVLKATVRPAVVTEEALLGAVERIYQRKEELAGLASQVAADVGEVLNLSGLESSATADDAPIVKLLNSIFQSAVTRDVSDIHIEPQERSLQIRFRIDGVMQVQSSPDARIAGAVVQRLKLMANLDISEKRLPQDGRFRIKVSATTLDVRISTLPTQFGESVVMRLLAQNVDRMRLDALDIPEPILKRLRATLTASSGMVLVTGPTGSGKTTTLYAALAELNRPATKIITVEDPVEYRQPGLNQVQVNDKVDLTFSRVLRACLRQDPDVILVGEMRDTETAEIGLRAALTGHLVLSTLHTTSAAGTPMRLRDMGVAPYMVALGVRLVLAQRLVRTLCAHCSVEAEPAPHELEWLAAGAEQDAAGPPLRARRGTGCPACHGSGYRGRTAVYEMLEMTPALVHLANADDPAGFAAEARRAFAAFTLRRAALTLVRAGRTSLAEAMRIGSGL
ncbi:MAG: Flp pilus assembly complex ATPase component TadA [Rubrivivax sp.]|nr:Flp pilus assembly complex ATPase component TadA [Rubrivivax sp.]